MKGSQMKKITKYDLIQCSNCGKFKTSDNVFELREKVLCGKCYQRVFEEEKC